LSKPTLKITGRERRGHFPLSMSRLKTRGGGGTTSTDGGSKFLGRKSRRWFNEEELEKENLIESQKGGFHCFTSHQVNPRTAEVMSRKKYKDIATLREGKGRAAWGEGGHDKSFYERGHIKRLRGENENKNK